MEAKWKIEAADQVKKLLTLCHSDAMDVTNHCRVTATVLLSGHICWHELALTRHIPLLIEINLLSRKYTRVQVESKGFAGAFPFSYLCQHRLSGCAFLTRGKNLPAAPAGKFFPLVLCMITHKLMLIIIQSYNVREEGNAFLDYRVIGAFGADMFDGGVYARKQPGRYLL